MKKLVLALSLLGFMGSASASVNVRFAGDCAGGQFDAQNLDVEYFNLNLDLFGSGKAECVITTTVPARRGYYVLASEFLAQGQAVDVQNIASLFVNHRFNGQIIPGKRDTARIDKDLTVIDRAFAKSQCGRRAVIRTKITATTNRAQFLFDQATSNTKKIRYKYRYVRC